MVIVLQFSFCKLKTAYGMRISDWSLDLCSSDLIFAWPQPAGSGGSGGSINNIADLAHPAVNGHGGFYSAKTPEAFTSGLKDALKRASERNGTGASLAANSTKMETGTEIGRAHV